MDKKARKRNENSTLTEMPPGFASDWKLATGLLRGLKNPEEKARYKLTKSDRERWKKDITVFYEKNKTLYR